VSLNVEKEFLNIYGGQYLRKIRNSVWLNGSERFGERS
jgi:hypothetical protein